MQAIIKSTVSIFNELSNKKDYYQGRREQFLGGDKDGWFVDFLPDPDVYLQAVAHNIHTLLSAYQQSAQKDGFDRWGIKHPALDFSTLSFISKLLPHGRFIYIYRDVFDTAKSAKARKFIGDAGSFAEFAQHWQTNLCSVLDAGPRENLLVLRYEDIHINKTAFLEKLADFSSLQGIDPDVLRRRINTFPQTSEQSGARSDYILPKELSEEEKSLLFEHARIGLERAGYLIGEDGKKRGQL